MVSFVGPFGLTKDIIEYERKERGDGGLDIPTLTAAAIYFVIHFVTHSKSFQINS